MLIVPPLFPLARGAVRRAARVRSWAVETYVVQASKLRPERRLKRHIRVWVVKLYEQRAVCLHLYLHYVRRLSSGQSGQSGQTVQHRVASEGDTETRGIAIA